MLCLARNSFEKVFDPSSFAAAARGPKHLSPAASKRSTTPSTSGCYGPTMVKSMFSA